ncbi:MAG: hypothetical protein U9R53_09000 [Chloroflexota bacterium]|nr:hypothetical protein [Chloroflexota bacterium]
MKKSIKNKFLYSWMILAVLFFSITFSVYGQGNEYTVHLRRDFGYGGGSNIRGTFTIILVGQDDQVESATFLMDGNPMIVVQEVPFKYQFHTDAYGFGDHFLSAQVTLEDGSVEVTPALQYNFVSPEAEREQVVTILVAIGSVILITLVIFGVVQAIFLKDRTRHGKRPVEGQHYGLLGGTICPKCGCPFSRHIWALNLVVGRLDRCEYCGKWVMTTRATPEALREAESMQIANLAEVDNEIPIPESKEDLDQTRYIDHI